MHKKSHPLWGAWIPYIAILTVVSRSIREGSEKRGTLFGTPVFSPIFLSFLRQTRSLSKVNGGKRGIPPNLFPVPQIVRMPIRTHDVLSYSCYSSSLFLISSNIACMVGLSLVSFLMLMSSTLLLAIRSWLSDPCSSRLTFCR